MVYEELLSSLSTKFWSVKPILESPAWSWYAPDKLSSLLSLRIAFLRGELR